MERLDNIRFGSDASGVLGKGFEEFITIGTTRLFGRVGNYADINQPVNNFPEKTKDDWIAEKIRDGVSQSEAETLWKQRKRFENLRTIDGNVFGALVEDELTGTTTNIDLLRKHDSHVKQLALVGLTFDESVSRVKGLAETAVKNIKKAILDKHGSSAKIFTEVPVFSKSMSTDMQAAIRTAANKLGEKVPKAVKGALDIVVQDANGELHMYDVKLSSLSIAK